MDKWHSYFSVTDSASATLTGYQIGYSQYQRERPDFQAAKFQNMVFNQLAIAPFVISSIYLLQSNALGIDWLIPGIALSFVKAIVDAWVLGIENQR